MTRPRFALLVLVLGCQRADYSDVGDVAFLVEEFGCAHADAESVRRACDVVSDFSRGGAVAFPRDGEEVYLGFMYCENGYTSINVTTLRPPGALAPGVDAEHVPPGTMTRQHYDRRGRSKTLVFNGPVEDHRSWQSRIWDGTYRVLPGELEEWGESSSPQTELSLSDGISLLPNRRGVRRAWYSGAPDEAPNAFMRASEHGELLYLGVGLSLGLNVGEDEWCVERAFRVRRDD